MPLQQAIQAIKSGNKELGRQELSRILEADPNNAMAWIWLSACYEDMAKRKECLQATLKADPTNQIVLQGLERLKSMETTQPKKTSTLLASTEAGSPESSFRTRVAETEEAGLQYSNLAWICPKCDSRNMTPIVLYTPTTLRCPRCTQEYECLNGEAVWGQCNVDSAVWSQWFDWIIRLQQVDGSIVEVGFTLCTSDFTIAGGDFLVVFMKRTWGGKDKVVQVENKTKYTPTPGE